MSNIVLLKLKWYKLVGIVQQKLYSANLLLEAQFAIKYNMHIIAGPLAYRYVYLCEFKVYDIFHLCHCHGFYNIMLQW